MLDLNMGDNKDKKTKRRSSSDPKGLSPNNKLSPSTPQSSPRRAGTLTGIPKVVDDIVTSLYNTIQLWNEQHNKGANIVKQIASIKADNPGEYPPPLEELTTELYEIVQPLRMHKDALFTLAAKMKTLCKLKDSTQPVFLSLGVSSLTDLVVEIAQAYGGEFEMKELVLEKIAHSNDRNEAMFLAALWTYQHKINDSVSFKLETLLIEVGHKKF